MNSRYFLIAQTWFFHIWICQCFHKSINILQVFSGIDKIYVNRFT